MNRQLCLANDEFMFVTLALLLLDLDTGTAPYLNAGHNPILFAAAGQPFENWEPPSGMLLGVHTGATFGSGGRTTHPPRARVVTEL